MNVTLNENELHLCREANVLLLTGLKYTIEETRPPELFILV